MQAKAKKVQVNLKQLQAHAQTFDVKEDKYLVAKRTEVVVCL
jgi:hypothetical protein